MASPSPPIPEFRPDASDKLLFTPGPLTTSLGVKLAMLRDLGSRDASFVETVRRIRGELLSLAGVSVERGYEAVLIQGSGTFGVESVISSIVPRDGKLLVAVNGAYGERILRIASVLGLPTAEVRSPENRTIAPDAVDRALEEDPAITDVALVHCETTTGILNPLRAIGAIVRRHGRRFIVDSMSAFGAVPFDFEACAIDFLVSSANKCIEGAPGFSFVICRREPLVSSEGRARSLSLDLLSQWRGLEANGQFRFTPPTHAILAFERALRELEKEGGIQARGARYRKNHEITVEGMRKLGFREYLAPELQGPIITSFRYPDHPAFRFDEFYDRLNRRGYVIYPGKVSSADCFRIGHIGRLFPTDVHALLGAIESTLEEMGIRQGAHY